LKGDFPIGFLIWKTNDSDKKKTQLTEIVTEVLDKNAKAIGEKHFYNIPNKEFLSLWMPRLKTNSINVPLKNAVTPQTNHAKVTAWIDNAIAYMYCNSNDMQNAAQQTAITSSVFSTGNGFYVTLKTFGKQPLYFL